LLFKGFSELDGEDELRESNALEAHATLVMGVFDEAIQNIAKLDYVFQLLEKVGRSHQRFPGFTGDLFWVSSYLNSDPFRQQFAVSFFLPAMLLLILNTYGLQQKPDTPLSLTKLFILN
jgi:hypothetical protein